MYNRGYSHRGNAFIKKGWGRRDYILNDLANQLSRILYIMLLDRWISLMVHRLGMQEAW